MAYRSVLGNSLSRLLCLSLRTSVGTDPRPSIGSCLACMTRLAMSEQGYLVELVKDIFHRMGDDLPVNSVGIICPVGSLDSTPPSFSNCLMQVLQRPSLVNGQSLCQLCANLNPRTSFLGSSRIVHLGSCSLSLPMPDPKTRVQSEILQFVSQDLYNKDLVCCLPISCVSPLERSLLLGWSVPPNGLESCCVSLNSSNHWFEPAGCKPLQELGVPVSALGIWLALPPCPVFWGVAKRMIVLSIICSVPFFVFYCTIPGPGGYNLYRRTGHRCLS